LVWGSGDKILLLLSAIIWHFEGQEKHINVKSVVTWLSSLTASDLSLKQTKTVIIQNEIIISSLHCLYIISKKWERNCYKEVHFL